MQEVATQTKQNNEQNAQVKRNELFKTIWGIADKLRGAVDGWDFKQFVLGIIFYRYLCENLTSYINAYEQALDPNFDYATLNDEQAQIAKEVLLKEKGFFIPPSELFSNVLKRADKDEDLNINLNKIFQNIEASSLEGEAQENFRGLFADLDMDSSKLGDGVKEKNEKISSLLKAVGAMKIEDYQESGIDIFGDAYEFLMGMYASNAGKSGGEFFTPQEVSELLARLVLHGQKDINKVYDPCCGSGSLLLKFAKILGKDNIKQGFFGQEINPTTYNLCRANMFLHNIDYDTFHIAYGDTLIDPKHESDEPFDAIVSNPPYSTKWIGDDDPLLINKPRFAPAGVLAPKGKADLAFSLHMLFWLSPKGTCAIVQFPGVLYRGGAEAKIRQYLIERNFVDGVIALAPDLFFGTNIATCVLILRKNRGDHRVLFMDASLECVRADTQNKLSPANIAKILKVYETREELPHFSILVEAEQIRQNGYNLSVSRYLDPKEEEGGLDIAQLNAQIATIVAKQQALREGLDKIIDGLENGANGA
ncbi:type I restriction-modification system subunit M [Helicobacter salomonis]|uniref:type I restriction-modification system subunit M n=1 Tax=Helicobacter salomonis TaxID=56878 RepID=UPI000CF1A078|nr:type I restriction-modification system subunit M [Helicobacter salomonis]